ncbi:MAG: hypothetical protein J5770_02110 [Bacteroidaceae bacterium]|nr:hypothetical protein [Bacteroidaceae bacterium]
MIKKFIYLAMVALAVTAFVACGDDDDDNNNNQNNGVVQLTTPPYKNEAKVVNITDNEAGIKQLRIMGNGSYMIASIVEPIAARETRADLVDFTYDFGTFTYENGVFKFSNGMTVAFQPTGSNTFDITITWKGGTTIKTTGTIDTSKSVTPGVMTDNLCSHAWKVETLYAACKFNGKKVYKEFAGPTDLFDVKKWFEDNVGTLKDQFEAGTVIEGIYFDANGLFAINYLNRHDDVGIWRWSDMNVGNLVYSWNNAATAISLFTGDASVSFSKNPDTCLLTLKGNVDNTDLEFIFTLK